MLVTGAEAALTAASYLYCFILIVSFPPINYWPKYVVVHVLREEVVSTY